MRPVSMTVKNIPRSHWHCSLENFDYKDIGPKGTARVEWFIKEMEAGRAPHLILHGQVGSGKTHLAVALYRWIVFYTRNAGAAYYLNLPNFCDKVKRSFENGGPDRIWEDIGWADAGIIIDDLNGRVLTEWERSQVLYRLIDSAYRNNAALIITDNEPPEKWQERITGHEISRILQNVESIKFIGKDRRMA